MTITVHLFARAKDLVQAESVTIELPNNASVFELRRHLANEYPVLGQLLERSAIAVDCDFAQDDTRLTPDAEIAIIPPVSGG